MIASGRWGRPAGGEFDLRSGSLGSHLINGGLVAVTITRRLALMAGLSFFGLLAGAGCSGSSSSPSSCTRHDEDRWDESRGLSGQDRRDEAAKASERPRRNRRTPGENPGSEPLAAHWPDGAIARPYRNHLRASSTLNQANSPQCVPLFETRRSHHFHATFARLHADRTARRHRHHRRPDRPAAARGAGGARGRPPRPVRQQPQAARPGRPQLRRRQPVLPVGDVLHVPAATFVRPLEAGAELLHLAAPLRRGDQRLQRLQLQSPPLPAGELDGAGHSA